MPYGKRRNYRRRVRRRMQRAKRSYRKTYTNRSLRRQIRQAKSLALKGFRRDWFKYEYSGNPTTTGQRLDVFELTSITNWTTTFGSLYPNGSADSCGYVRGGWLKMLIDRETKEDISRWTVVLFRLKKSCPDSYVPGNTGFQDGDAFEQPLGDYDVVMNPRYFKTLAKKRITTGGEASTSAGTTIGSGQRFTMRLPNIGKIQADGITNSTHRWTNLNHPQAKNQRVFVGIWNTSSVAITTSHEIFLTAMWKVLSPT